MFNIKTALELIEANSLVYEPPISAMWETFKIGVNITDLSDCPSNNETCINEQIKNGNASVENAIIVAIYVSSVSIILMSNL